MRAVMPGASRPVKVRISSLTPASLRHGRGAGAALSRRDGDRLQALRAALGGGRGRRLLQKRLGEEEDDERDEEEVDDAPEEISVLDRVLAGEGELRVAPLAPGRTRPISGISTSSTMPETTLPMAAPMITPIASANAFCLRRNSRNSFVAEVIDGPWHTPRRQASGRL